MQDMIAQSQFVMKYAFVLLVGFVTAFVLTPLVGRLARKIGLIDIPGERRIHATPTPRCGISVFLAFHAACAAVLFLPWIPFRGNLDVGWWTNFLMLSSLILIVGLIDDRWSLRARTKLAGQVIVAVLAFFCDMNVGRLLGVHLPLALDLAVTVLWFVTIINAFNLIDGMDGLATGLASIACVGIAGSFLFRHTPGDALIVLGLMGACLGFLRYNFHPASIFLGDSGSMFLGFTLAAVAVSSSAKGTVFASVFVPLLAIGVPIFDTVLAVWRRTVRRLVTNDAEIGEPTSHKRIFDADMDHMHHRLLRSGLSDRAAATWLYLFSIALVAIGFLSMMYHSAAVGIFILAFVGGSYVFVRHLARVELWDSAVVITQGLHRPPSRAMAALFYPVLDALAMALALALACFMSAPGHGLESLKLYWFDQIPLWVGVPFLALLAARTYSRVWSRARVSEYVGLSVALTAGILLAASVSLMTGGFAPTFDMVAIDAGYDSNTTILLGQTSGRSMPQQVIIHMFVSLFLVAGMRALPRAAQDSLAWHQRLQTQSTVRQALIYGAGYDCTLYLLQQSFLKIGTQEPVYFIGMIDDDVNLKGRYVHGYKVFGGFGEVESIMTNHHVTDIVVTIELDQKHLDALLALAASKQLRLTQWSTQSRTISAPPAS
jgi:UDP-GlcNAc:undecaprenyl-phosphate/decaprenyl-phosphate GlcNAc-1-phosphate transferase